MTCWVINISDRSNCTITRNTSYVCKGSITITTSKYNFIIELAVAGFKKDEIEITTEKNSLKVTGKKEGEDDRNYISKGIAGRKFSRQFVLSDTIVVKGADLEDEIGRASCRERV